MIISSIEVQKKDENRRSVFIDGEFAFGLLYADVLFYNLVENEEITQEKYNSIIRNKILTSAKDKAFNFLSFKNRTVKEMKKKLLEKEFSDDVINQVIEMLMKYNYLNDAEYAKKFIKDKLEIKGYGKYRIKSELKQKGIEIEIIDELLVDTECIEIEKVITLINKKLRFRTLESLDIKEKRKIYNFLQRRGYSYNVINESFEIIREGR